MWTSLDSPALHRTAVVRLSPRLALIFTVLYYNHHTDTVFVVPSSLYAA